MKPVLKWVGGKRQLLNTIIELMPKDYNTYFEPFVGGGAVLFSLEPQKAYINDLNSELYNLYNIIKSKKKLKALVLELDKHELNHSKEYYYKLRQIDRTQEFNNLEDYEIAARTIYLNKAGFNGLFRVNANGQFNVPFGKKENVRTYDLENLKEIQKYFSKTKIKITNVDFQKAVKKAGENDFVYFDPPYDKIKDDTFTSYQTNDFNRDEQVRLFNVFSDLNKKGVKVMLSNHNTDFIRELYKDFNIHIVLAKRMINSDASKRGNIEEVIITNYEVDKDET